MEVILDLDEATVKEMRKQEEIAKAKLAMERKKKLAEKAAAKAAIRAQKEAEKKEQKVSYQMLFAFSLFHSNNLLFLCVAGAREGGQEEDMRQQRIRGHL